MSHLLLHPPPPIPMTHLSKTSAPSILFAKPLGTLRLQPMILNRAATVRCMANPRRVQKVAKQIMREISDMLLTDKVVKRAVLPEVAFGADLYLSSLATVSDVEVSKDLQVAKIYVSVFGDDRGKEVAIAGLKAKSKYIRGQLGKRMRLRMTPEVRIIEDESIERGSRVIAILDKLKREEENAGSESDEESSDAPEDDSDWEEDDDDDDPDENIIYVD